MDVLGAIAVIFTSSLVFLFGTCIHEEMKLNTWIPPRNMEPETNIILSDNREDVEDLGEKADRCVVTMSVRDLHYVPDCFNDRLDAMEYYALLQGARFYPIRHHNHEALSMCPVSVRYHKLWIVKHYLQKCKHILWIDDSTQFDPNAIPLLFDVYRDYAQGQILAASDVLRPQYIP